MQAEITVKVNLDDDMVQEIMEDAGYDEFTQEQAKAELEKLDIAELIGDFSDIVVTTIEMTV